MIFNVISFTRSKTRSFSIRREKFVHENNIRLFKAGSRILAGGGGECTCQTEMQGKFNLYMLDNIIHAFKRVRAVV